MFTICNPHWYYVYRAGSEAEANSPGPSPGHDVYPLAGVDKPPPIVDNSRHIVDKSSSEVLFTESEQRRDTLAENPRPVFLTLDHVLHE